MTKNVHKNLVYDIFGAENQYEQSLVKLNIYDIISQLTGCRVVCQKLMVIPDTENVKTRQN